MKVKEIIGEYIQSSRYSKLSKHTKHQYWQAIRKIEGEFGDRKIETLRRADIVRAHDKMGKTPATANIFARVSSIIFNYAVDMDYIGANPASRIKMYKINTWSRWDLEEVKKVILANHPIVSTAVALAFYTGQREADILNMKWEDIRDGKVFVKQAKTGTELEIKLAPELVTYLETIPKSGKYIIGGDKKMTGPSFRNMFKRVTRAMGIERQFHGIRKTVGAMLAERGRNTNEIAALLGHKTLAMAALYTRQASNKKMIASAVNDLTFD